VEEQLRELRDSGALRNLPGEGEPLPADPDAEAGDAWAARHLSRVAAARAPWADLRQEIREERARLLARLRAHDAWLRGRAELIATVPAERILGETARTRETDRRVRLQVAARVEELNALVRRHNILVTGSTLHLATVTLDELIAESRRAS
jgi:DnaJ-like protein